jgi:hypothetical protein
MIHQRLCSAVTISGTRKMTIKIVTSAAAALNSSTSFRWSKIVYAKCRFFNKQNLLNSQLLKQNNVPVHTLPISLIEGKENVLWQNAVTLFWLPQCSETPWPLVCKRTIPTERPPLVGEI